MFSEKAAWWAMLKRPPAGYVIIAFGVWWVFVGLSGKGIGLGQTWDFSATAQLGDSFGIVSALMTSMAAIFTYQTLVDTRRQTEAAERNSALQKEEADRIRAEAAEDRQEAARRNQLRDEVEFKRDTERTFFGLLDLRLRLLADIQTGHAEFTKSGTDAIAELTSRISSKTYNQKPDDHENNYVNMYRKNVNDLGHYLRFTYHIVKFSEENFKKDSYIYVRLLRAQLSNSELILIAMNCAHGEGKEKFLKFVEKYSLLHNINFSDRAKYKLDDYFRPRAFNPKAKASAAKLGAIDPLSVQDF